MRADAVGCLDLSGARLAAPPAPPRRAVGLRAGDVVLVVAKKVRKCKTCQKDQPGGFVVVEQSAEPPQEHQEWGLLWKSECLPCAAASYSAEQLAAVDVAWSSRGGKPDARAKLGEFPHLLHVVQTAQVSLRWRAAASMAWAAAPKPSNLAVAAAAAKSTVAAAPPPIAARTPGKPKPRPMRDR